MRTSCLQFLELLGNPGKSICTVIGSIYARVSFAALGVSLNAANCSENV